MHELSIAESILDIVQQYVPKGEERSVKSVRIKVGELSGVVPDSLEFCFTAITANTPLQGASLSIERIPFTLQCNECNATIRNDSGIILCPSCGGSKVTVVTGRELQVVDIELCDTAVEVPP